MTKALLARRIATRLNLNPAEALLAVHTILDSLTHTLQQGQKIELRGFGSFRVRSRKPRVGRNPKTGARVEVPAKTVVRFKPSRHLLAGVRKTEGQ